MFSRLRYSTVNKTKILKEVKLPQDLPVTLSSKQSLKQLCTISQILSFERRIPHGDKKISLRTWKKINKLPDYDQL